MPGTGQQQQRIYRITRDGQGMGGFLSPPGHPKYYYVLEEMRPSGRGKPLRTYSLDYVFDLDNVAVKMQAGRILETAILVDSDLWERYVYGYFRHMYVPVGGSRNAADLVSNYRGELPAERHAAVVTIRKYFPDHAPRLDLIADPGHGYGSWPCIRCGARVQYEARHDALVAFGKSEVYCGKDHGKHEA